MSFQSFLYTPPANAPHSMHLVGHTDSIKSSQCQGYTIRNGKIESRCSWYPRLRPAWCVIPNRTSLKSIHPPFSRISAASDPGPVVSCQVPLVNMPEMTLHDGRLPMVLWPMWGIRNGKWTSDNAKVFEFDDVGLLVISNVPESE